MAKSSISADIKAANSKLAKFLRSREEEESLIQIGKQKPKHLEEEKRLPKGPSRWSAPIDFTVPTCLVDRPRTGSSATTFHFAFTHVKKEAVPTIDGMPLDPADKIRQPAFDHSIYIERDGAAEVVEGTKHARYIEREGAVESVKSIAPNRSSKHSIPTLLDGEERTLSEEFGINGGGVTPATLAVFSNISDDPFERQEYWRAIERTEREPKSHYLTFYPEVCEKWWSSIEDAEGLDPDLRAHLLSVFHEYRRHIELVAAGAVPGAFHAPKYPALKAKHKLDAERAGRLLEQARRVPGYNSSDPPIQFKSGRGGRTQYRFVAGLPHEISAEDRASIVRGFCGKLEALEIRTDDNGVERQVGMMYTAVIHAPDGHNDPRNYHLHIVAHDRPAKFMPEFGMWDFEVEERYRSHRKWRVRRPHRQNKIGAISRAGNGADYNRSGQSFVSAMRQDFATIVNKVLEARGLERRYDPRSFADMGLDLTPTEHLGTRAAALEAIGVVTTVGQLNAITIWNDSERGIERQVEGLQREYQARQEVIEELIEKATSVDVLDPALENARTLASERRTLISQIVDHQRAIKIFDHREAKAKSRAKRTLRTCRAHLDDIKTGAADKSIVKMKSSVQARLDVAQHHLDTIDAALAPYRDDLDRARQTIHADKARVACIDKEIKALMACVSEISKKAVNERKQRDAALREAEQAKKAYKDRSVATELIETQTAVSPPQPKIPGDDVLGNKDAHPVREASEQMNADVSVPGAKEIENLPQTQKPIESSKDEESAQSSPDQDPSTAKAKPPRQAVAAGDHVTTPEVSTAATKPEVDEELGAETSIGRSKPAKSRKTDMAMKDHAVREDRVDGPQAAPRQDQADQKAGKVIRNGKPHKNSEHEVWNDLMNRIRRDRIPIEVREARSGKLVFEVPSLSDADQGTLKLLRFSYRTQPRLEEIHSAQHRERVRLGQWIKKHARDPEKIKIAGGKADLGDVRPAVKTLMRNWETHPDIQISLSTLGSPPSKDVIKAPAEVEKGTSKGKTVREEKRDHRTELREDAERKYPHPDKMETKAGAKFTRLLRKLAPEDELREAAHDVFSSTLARRDVHQHGPELIKAYKDHSNGLPPSLLRQGQERRARE